MKLLEVFFLSVGLAMDAFAVSVCKGLALKKATVREWLICGVWFGLFQGLMPLLGYLLGSGFATIINAIAPWLAFILLSIIGINMIREAFGSEEGADDDLGFKTMLMLAIATSIDAFAIGITFVAIPVRILDASALTNTLLAVSMIAIITLIISSLGVMIGHKFGTVYQSGAQLMGGTILLFIGLNSLISSLDKFDLMNDPDTIFGLLIPLIGTVIGASFAFLKNNRISSNTNSILSGLSAGTMLALSARALLNPLIDKESETSLPFLVSLFVFFWLGVLIQYALDRYVPHTHVYTGVEDGPESDLKSEIRMMLAKVIHHIPEGIFLGVVYAMHFLESDLVKSPVALVAAIALSVQNFPEAFFVSLPIRQQGLKSSRAFLMGIISGISLPLMGLITVIVNVLFPLLLNLTLAMSAGAMIFAVIEELIPQMLADHNRKGTFALIASFSLTLLAMFL